MDEKANLHLQPDAAAEMAANAVLKYLHECDLKDDKKRLKWIEHVFDRVKAKGLARDVQKAPD